MRRVDMCVFFIFTNRQTEIQSDTLIDTQIIYMHIYSRTAMNTVQAIQATVLGSSCVTESGVPPQRKKESKISEQVS